MKVEQIYTNCLAQGTYYIVSDGEAVIIDPLRDFQYYLDKLESDGVRLKYILETHFHADFVSGHLDLSLKTGAEIIFGPNADPSFNARIADDGEVLTVGKLKIKVLHTPGHTLESTCYLMSDEEGIDKVLFTGDTLFIGDVGRPDLAQKNNDFKKEDLAELLYDSLYTKILPLNDDIIIYPAHGAGSACGKNMSQETYDSLGNQKRTNYALNQPSKAAFVKAVLTGLTEPPLYFADNVRLNRQGYKNYYDILKKAKHALSLEKFSELQRSEDVVILDVRDSSEFVKGFIPKSINIGLRGDFAPWVGSILKVVNQKILLVAEEDDVDETITRLARVGFDGVSGYLEGGFNSWLNSGETVDHILRMDTDKLQKLLLNENLPIVDVRKESEYYSQHIEWAQNFPLQKLDKHMNHLPSEKFVLHCAGGYRSSIAASLLKRNGIHDFIEVNGGFNAIKKGNIPLTDWVCSSMLAS